MDLKGAVRGRKLRIITADRSLTRPSDLENREFTAKQPDQLWGSRSDVCCHHKERVCPYIAFVIDVFAGFIVNWRVSKSLNTDLALDVL